MRVRDIEIAQPEGTPKVARKKIRKCKACEKKLSMYNDNDYCFVHTLKGFKLEQAEIERKKFVAHQKHLKKMKERKGINVRNQ